LGQGIGDLRDAQGALRSRRVTRSCRLVPKHDGVDLPRRIVIARAANLGDEDLAKDAVFPIAVEIEIRFPIMMQGHKGRAAVDVAPHERQGMPHAMIVDPGPEREPEDGHRA
jgi:hypothetical protein